MAYTLRKSTIGAVKEVGGIAWTVEVPYGAKVKIIDVGLSSYETTKAGGTKADINLGSIIDIVLTECVKGWGGVVDEKGEAVPFTLEHAKLVDTQTLMELANWVLAELVLGGGEAEKKDVPA